MLDATSPDEHTKLRGEEALTTLMRSKLLPEETFLQLVNEPPFRAALIRIADTTKFLSTSGVAEMAKLLHDASLDDSLLASVARMIISADPSGKALVSAFRNPTSNERIRNAIFGAFIQAFPAAPEVIALVKEIVRTDNNRMIAGLEFLVARNVPNVEETIEERIRNGPENKRRYFISLLRIPAQRSDHGFRTLVRYAETGTEWERQSALYVLGHLTTSARFRALQPLYRAAGDISPFIRFAAGKSLLRLGDHREGSRTVLNALKELITSEQSSGFNMLMIEFPKQVWVELAQQHIQWIESLPQRSLYLENFLLSLKNNINNSQRR